MTFFTLEGMGIFMSRSISNGKRISSTDRTVNIIWGYVVLVDALCFTHSSVVLIASL